MLNLSQGRRKTADQGVPIPQPFVSFDYNGIHFRRGSLSLIAAAPGGGKALSVDTPILTTAGWKTMGDVTVGDEVYGSDGRPTTVVAATGIMRDRRVYRIRFDDGEEVVADANHEWVVEDRRYRQGRKSSMTRLTTEDMASSYRLESGRRLNYSIPLVGVKGQDADLPVDPYILGYWLGDGTTRLPNVTVWWKDAAHFLSEVRRSDLNADLMIGGKESPTIKLSRGGFSKIVGDGRRELIAEFRSLGVLGRKHVPELYMRSSRRQRLRLLQGMADSDGTPKPGSRSVSITFTSQELSDDLAELARSLGYKVSRWRKACAGRRPESSVAYTVSWSTDDDILTLPRKSERLGGSARPTTKRRFIESVEQIESVPVKCIQVEAEDSLYLCGRGLVLTHNSALAQNIVTRGDGNGTVARTFYFSADSDAQTMFTRSAAMSTGYEMSEVERLMREGGMEMLDARVRQATAHINYSFKSTLDVDYMMDELTAYAHVYGEWPEVIVADNLSNIEVGVDDEWRGLGEASFFLMDLARDTGAAVIALHHVSGEHEAGGRPIPLSGLRGKVSKLPALILTLHRAQGLKVSVTKNRSGRADPGGNFGVELTADLARMSFEG